MYNIHVINMSTRTLDGTYTTFVSNVRSNANARYGAIGVVGHMDRGVKQASDGTDTTLVDGTNWAVFDTGSLGTIYTFDNFGQVANLFGSIKEARYVDGTNPTAALGISGYDAHTNLIRSLELIYLANPNARTHVAVLTGSGSTAAGAASEEGVSEALGELLKYDDISYIVGAGMDYNNTFLTHAKTASNETNKAERIYVGGVGLNEILSGTNNTLDITDYTSLQDDSGRGVFVAGNVNYKFQSAGRLNEGEKEIGGNFLASYVAGMLSAIPEQESLLRKSTGFKQIFSGSEFRFNNTQLTSLVDDNMLVMRNANNRNSFSRALTFSTSSGNYQRITKRRIVDRVSKEIRATTDGFVGQPNNEVSRLGMTSSLRTKLNSLAAQGLIDATANARVFVEAGDVDAGTVRVAVTFRPATEIEFVEVQQTVEI